MINNSTLQKWQRLRQKKLSQQFINEIIRGLNCSQFEAEAILETVYQVFHPYFETNGTIKPGQLFLEVVSESAPPQLALKDCPMVTVLLTLDAGEDDLRVKEQKGVVGLRQHRIERLCHETHQQGGLLTVEDLANRLLNCGERTISRDIALLRKKNITLPMRSTIKDMGRSITHRSVIVQHWLQGKEYTDISRLTCHSVDAIGNYIDKFKRTISLFNEGYDNGSISFLVKISTRLAQEYINLYKTSKIVEFRKKELTQFLKKHQLVLINSKVRQ